MTGRHARAGEDDTDIRPLTDDELNDPGTGLIAITIGIPLPAPAGFHTPSLLSDVEDMLARRGVTPAFTEACMGTGPDAATDGLLLWVTRRDEEEPSPTPPPSSGTAATTSQRTTEAA